MIVRYSNKQKHVKPRHVPIRKIYKDIENAKEKINYEIFAYCSENYKDAYDFVIDSWINTNSSKITIYTDFDLKSKNDKVQIIKLFNKTSSNWITGTGRRLDVIKHFNDSLKGEVKNVLFLDIDCYIVRDITEVFSENFDIAITRLYSTEQYSNRTATAGLWFAKTTPQYHEFINDWIQLAKVYQENKKGITEHRISYVQYSFTDIARKYLKHRQNVILPIDEKKYNSEHTLLSSWMKLITNHRPSILHFKGRRFRNQLLVQKVLKLAGNKNGKSKNIVRGRRSKMGIRAKSK